MSGTPAPRALHSRFSCMYTSTGSSCREHSLDPLMGKTRVKKQRPYYRFWLRMPVFQVNRFFCEPSQLSTRRCYLNVKSKLIYSPNQKVEKLPVPAVSEFTGGWSEPISTTRSAVLRRSLGRRSELVRPAGTAKRTPRVRSCQGAVREFDLSIH
jgi:hypothetical protein